MRKIIIISILLISCNRLSFAQFGQNLFSSVNQQLIEQAVGDGIMLIRQEYQLEDTVTMKRYTWNNQPEFGNSQSFCVLTENGYIASNKVLEPWKYDSKYAKYKDSVYRPVLSKTYCRTISDDKYREVGCLSPIGPRTLLQDDWIYVCDSTFNKRGFISDTVSGEKNGWLIWLTINNVEKIDTEQLTLVSYRHELSIEERKYIYEIPEPTTQRHIIGGIYVEPKYLEIGRIEFALIGIVVNIDNKWHVIRWRSESQSEQKSVIDQPTSALDDDALTPVEEPRTEQPISKKRKKNKS